MMPNETRRDLFVVFAILGATLMAFATALAVQANLTYSQAVVLLGLMEMSLALVLVCVIALATADY